MEVGYLCVLWCWVWTSKGGGKSGGEVHEWKWISCYRWRSKLLGKLPRLTSSRVMVIEDQVRRFAKIRKEVRHLRESEERNWHWSLGFFYDNETLNTKSRAYITTHSCVVILSPQNGLTRSRQCLTQSEFLARSVWDPSYPWESPVRNEGV